MEVNDEGQSGLPIHPSPQVKQHVMRAYNERFGREKKPLPWWTWNLSALFPGRPTRYLVPAMGIAALVIVVFFLLPSKESPELAQQIDTSPAQLETASKLELPEVEEESPMLIPEESSASTASTEDLAEAPSEIAGPIPATDPTSSMEATQQLSEDRDTMTEDDFASATGGVRDETDVKAFQVPSATGAELLETEEELFSDMPQQDDEAADVAFDIAAEESYQSMEEEALAPSNIARTSAEVMVLESKVRSNKRQARSSSVEEGPRLSPGLITLLHR